MVVDAGWFDALRRPNVRLHREAISELTADGIKLESGDVADIDVLILATGFRVNEYLSPIDIRGRGGRELHDVWGPGDARAYLGATMPGFPNLFIISAVVGSRILAHDPGTGRRCVRAGGIQQRESDVMTTQTRTTGRRMVFAGPGRPLEMWTEQVVPPPAGGMVIRMAIAGVCGTDAHRLDGDLPSDGDPIAFGHEGVGTVEELGTDVDSDWAGTPLKKGDLVFWAPTSRCGHCYYCTVAVNTGRCEANLWPPAATGPALPHFRTMPHSALSTKCIESPPWTPQKQ
ncbi:alcohol dehydrogenase catalytic domain-containing protein [Rhodococcus opacus]|nr:alcohol dehydrogenase catalytic domain-containing protein [Rhodococcus opacus]